MADANLAVNVATSADVEFSVGPKTAAWLVSIGWTAPAEAPADSATVEPVPAPVTPLSSYKEAREAMDARMAGLFEAQKLREALKAELATGPERVDQMLSLAGVPVGRMDTLGQQSAPPVSVDAISDPAPIVGDEDDSAAPLA